MESEPNKVVVGDVFEEDPGPKKIVITDAFGKHKPKYAMRLNLMSHEGIEALVVEVPEDLNARKWKIGDDIKLTVAGIHWKGGGGEGAQLDEGGR